MEEEKKIGRDRKEDRRVRRTRTNIRRAFLELLDEKNYTQITVTELAERADINRKTFYAYYTGMEDLLFDMEKEILDQYELLCSRVNFFPPNFNGMAYFGKIKSLFR